MKILVFNPGSSTLKFGVYDLPATEAVVSDVIEGAANSMSKATAEAIHRVGGLSIEAVGCRVVHGGPRFLEPTIVDGVTSDFLMARDETFGPVAPIMTFGSLEEAIEIANETPYGLQGAAFTSSLRNAFLLGEGIRCGTVLINESNNYWDQLAPFGGMKKSGLGRELSNWILAELTEIKQISIDIAKVRE